ncbi:MAG: 16S rRNA (cytosine(967)-C(5))-methyltransferase RsmB [Clostridiales bacterium]|jgi:16S rRNA (cytosine967-C5)-methyltransferase|nr:16S rRNA (cytosine(967)-C(5))-methyltransferase RsmB [Clostridiales bacterium]
MPNEREIAINILMKIEREHSYSGIALSRNLSAADGLDARGRGFITEIVNGCMRNLIWIDYIIDTYSKLSVGRMEPFIRHLMRASVYQMKFMDRIPVSAAVDEAVKLARRHGFGGLAGFVNAVLRNIARSDVPLPDRALGLDRFLSVRYSFPMWITRYYLDRFGPETAEEICEAAVRVPRVHICVNTPRISRAELLKRLEAEPLGANGAVLPKTSDIAKLQPFKDGLFHVMDYSSMRAVEALDPKPGCVVMDLCAAPGGKSFYCAYLMRNEGRIYAWDIHPHKVSLIKSSARRLGLENLTARAADARVFDERFAETADCVLIDAPCTGLGVAGRKPDIKYSRTEADIQTLATLQREILSAGWKYVKPGGRLVYSTCTLTREENEDNAAWFASRFPFILDYEATLPPGESDGFYIARFIRRKEL